MFYPPLMMYFYNLIHDTQKQKKNLAIRLILIGLIPLYQRWNDTFEMLSFFVFSFILFILICWISKTKLINRYFHHLCLICIYCIAMLYFSSFADNKIVNVLLLVLIVTPSLIFLALMMYCIIALLFSFKLLKEWCFHDMVCLLWYFALVPITMIENPHIVALFANIKSYITQELYYIALALFVLTLFILGSLIILHHSYYFLKLTLTNQRKIQILFFSIIFVYLSTPFFFVLYSIGRL
ncbi:hypothetical protein BBW65_05745 [Helicobacter enhydrae]|uniref:Uncharacterized protein n=1 Tax=Helicobacter enhydrae TaxID=222136 RepID=A0A1B1U6K7_9HELI|nr:hypothetical protein BBW65_05745 [Helicobacter enhydrae]